MKIKKLIPVNEKMVQVRVMKNTQGNLSYVTNPVIGVALCKKGQPHYVVHSRLDDFGHLELHEGCELRSGVYEDVYFASEWEANEMAILERLYAEHTRLTECKRRLKENPDAVFEGIFGNLFTHFDKAKPKPAPTKTAPARPGDRIEDF